MLKLVIVDDEPIILRGLLETYNWEQMGFTVVGSAENGEKALEVIRKTKPELVLTDIRMKKMTGLMLMEQVKEEKPDITFVVISAYRDFEYAQKACEVGAFSYLLKPMEEEQLQKTMKAAYQHCIELIQNRAEHENWKKLINQDGQHFLHLVIQKYLQNKIGEDRIKEVFSILDHSLEEEDSFVSVCVDLDISYKITNQLDYEAERFALFQYLDFILKKQYNYWSFENENGNQMYILNTKGLHGIATIKKIMEEAKKERNCPIISAISREYKTVLGLRKSYSQAIKLFDMASVSGASAFTVSKEIPEDVKEEHYPNDLENRIINAIRKNDEDELKQIFIDFIYRLSSNEKEQIFYIHKLMIQIECVLKNSYGFTEQIEESVQNFYCNLYSLGVSKVIDICYKLICNIIYERKHSVKNQNITYFSEYMSIAMAYIEEHLSEEELSIVTVASHIYLNPLYFGRVFKQIHNMTFRQYILKQRMELGKRLIAEGKESMASICERIGIGNPSYFSQVFKQYTGVLPSEYKKEQWYE